MKAFGRLHGSNNIAIPRRPWPWRMHFAVLRWEIRHHGLRGFAGYLRARRGTVRGTKK